MAAAAAAAAMAVAEAGLACVSNPCAHGVCVDQLNSSSYSCYCVDGYTGLRCQTNWDECWSAPCLNGATCVDLVAALTCLCAPGFTGEFCQAEINECQSNPCQNNGTCHDLLNHYVCACPVGYSGVNCEIDVSVCNASSLWAGESPKCYHGGLCVDGPGLSYTCHCQPGWAGERCEEDVDECLLDPCYNAAVCLNTPGSFACACQFGFTGPLCEEAVVFCEANPCQNGALCVMEDHNATCYCVPDFHGSQCQDQYDDCLPYAPRCMNGGKCIDGVDSFLCSCPNSTSGVLCHCVTTPDGQSCEQLPHWFQDKPYQPIDTTEKDIFHHWFNFTHVLNESITDYIPSPTSTDEISVLTTSSVDISTYDIFPSETVPPSYEFVSSISPTIPREPKDFPTTSSVISAKEPPVYSELESTSVPYPSSELFYVIVPSASLLPSTMEWSESWSMQPSPVLPVPPSSPAVEDSAVLSSELVTSTSVPHITPTHVLEGSFLTPSVELVSLSLVSGFDVSTTPVFDSVPTLEPTPVLTLASSFLEPATSVLIDATASPPTFTSDITNATFLPGDDGLGNQTFTPGPEADLASTPPTPTPGDDLTTDTTSVTQDLITVVPLTTQLPENDTSYPSEQEVFNVTEDGILSSERPSLTTTSYTSPVADNITDAGLWVSTATDEPSTTTYDSVNITEVTTAPPVPASPEYEDTGGPTDVSQATTPPDYEDTGGTTTPAVEATRPTDGLVPPLTPDTHTEVFTPLFNATTEIDLNITSITVDEYNATSPLPTDVYNETVTVPPDVATTIKVIVQVDATNETEGVPTVAPPPSTQATGVTVWDNFTTEVTSFPGTESSEVSVYNESYTTDVTVFNESVFVTDVVPYNESYTPGLTTFIDSLFTRDFTTTNASLTTDVTIFNASLTTESALINDSLTTELSTYGYFYPNDSFPAVNTTIDLPYFTTIFSYVTEKTTFNDSLVGNQTTPDDRYFTMNDSYTTDLTTYVTDSEVETPPSAPRSTQAPLTDTPRPVSGVPHVTDKGPDTSAVTELDTEPAVVTTDGEVDARSTKAGVPVTPPTTGLVDLFTVVTEPAEEIENVTIPDYEQVYNASVNGFNITTTPMSSVATEASASPTPEGPLLPPSTSESTTESPPTYTATALPPLPLTTPTSPVSLTTAEPNITFQMTETLTPPTPTPDVDTTTGPGERDHTASSSVKDPVFDTTSQTPIQPPQSVTSMTPTTPSDLRPVTEPSLTSVTPVTTTETQSDQPTTVACGAGFCLNRGVCVVREGNYTCQCPFNYRGAACQIYVYINKPYFIGASYLGIHVGNMSLRRGVQVYVQFTSQDPNGLVAYSEGPSDAFFMLLLRNSLLQFVFSCGLQTVSFLQGNEKLSRNYLTDVSVRMWWTPYRHDAPWGPGKCSASMQVNGTAPIYSEQRSSSPWVRLGLLYLGGLPSSYSSPLVVKAGFLPRLKGCVSLLEVNGREIDMWLSGVSGERVEECGTAPCPPGSCYNGGSCVPGPALWSCRCPPGYQGELCERAECGGGGSGPCHSGRCVPTRHNHPLCLCPTHRHGLYCELERVVERPSYSGSVEGYSSYSAYRLHYDVTHTTALRLHFTTQALQQVGLMAYLGNTVRSARQDFLALSLVRGHLMLTWDLGAGPRRIMTPEALDTTLHTHSALIGRRGREAWLLVDAQKNTSAISQGYLSSLNTNNMLYIGGHPSWNMSHLPADMWRHEGFRGCVFDLRVASSPAGPWTALRIAGAANVKECGQNECHHDSCSNGGTCLPLGATIRCECPVGWKGPRCEVASHVCEGGGGSCAPGSSCLSGGSPGTQPTCLCDLGRTGRRCEKVINITDPHFSGEGSYLSVRARNLRRESQVDMSFKPTRPDGLLLLALPRTPPGDFMALALVNGTVQFTYHLGWRAPGLVVVRSEGVVRLQEWQTVRAWRRGGDGALTFKGTITRALSPAPAVTLLDVHTELFLGGVPDASLVPPAVAPSESRVPFRGCLRQVKINGMERDLRVPGGEVVRGAGVSDCDGTACGSQVCLHGGTCTPAGDTFVCACPQEYTGARCQLSRACLDHLCINGATCVPSQPSFTGKKKRRHAVPGEAGTETQIIGEGAEKEGHLDREDEEDRMSETEDTEREKVVRKTRDTVSEDNGVITSKKESVEREERVRKEGIIIRKDGKTVVSKLGGIEKGEHITREENPFKEDEGEVLSKEDGTEEEVPGQEEEDNFSENEVLTKEKDIEREERVKKEKAIIIRQDGEVMSKDEGNEREETVRRPGDVYRDIVKKEKAALQKDEVWKRVAGDDGSSSSRYYCVCPPGFYGARCQTGGEVGSVRFSGDSFALVPEGPYGSPAPDTDSLALNFTTTATHGLLLWRGQVDTPGEDFLGVGVSGGRVKVVWHLGGGAVGHLTTSSSVRDGEWHSLVVSRTGTVVTVFLDGHPNKSSSPGTYTQINDSQGLYVGGFPADVSVTYGTEGHFQGAFVGCLKDLIVHLGSSPIRFSSLSQGQDLQPC